jgi:hypothetical protein
MQLICYVLYVNERLKTPPATPLFPSLEMDAPAPELVIQREIPIVQPFSRVCIRTIGL